MNDNQKFWSKVHKDYVAKGYAGKPSIFAQEFADILAKEGVKTGKILELGAGLGQDGKFFADKGFDVVSTDLIKSDGVLELNMQNTPWRFPTEEFDIVYAHLSLHYFDRRTTENIFAEIYRVLKFGGTFAFFVNSKSDPEYDKNVEIENGLVKFDGKLKRFFDTDLALELSSNFGVILCDNRGETYKDSEKGIHNLIRYVGKKEPE